ncbi:hypothetical protein Leryth_019001 [Lithospermum erythrorhizon]|nr:hypothetical protein Leryth_019001 [Lithospermum erythrorhizon]
MSKQLVNSKSIIREMGTVTALSGSDSRRWRNVLAVLVGLVVLAEIGFLGKLDLERFTGSEESCEAWLEKEDWLEYSRDFSVKPIIVRGGEQDFKSCDVGCKFGDSSKPDAAFGIQDGASSVLRSMESSHYYSDNHIATARRRGFDVVMTTSLSSDVPVGYFSWAEYDIMAPVPPKTQNALAAAFISNCGARNFRLQALEALERAKINIDSYGSCHRNRDGKVDKVETLKHYKFSLAFENSNEEDYVTEKFFQSLVAGSVPVVVGAPNIQEFAPAPGSLLHIKELSDVDKVAETMKYLSQDLRAYNETLRLVIQLSLWKTIIISLSSHSAH